MRALAIARTKEDIAAVKKLFIAYQQELGIDLCFQNFDEEMQTFPAKYDVLLLARQDQKPLGAVGYWLLEPGIVEMKRLYVIPAARKTGLGRRLCESLINKAQADGHHRMKLDTLKRLVPALALYQSLGFTETDAYNSNPEQDILYLEKSLLSPCPLYPLSTL